LLFFFGIPYFFQYKRICQQLQLTIDHAENKIDELVYELYGLTKEEIEIVENG
jgi:hypothetical protein